jgi:hypothetical protein
VSQYLFDPHQVQSPPKVFSTTSIVSTMSEESLEQRDLQVDVIEEPEVAQEVAVSRTPKLNSPLTPSEKLQQQQSWPEEDRDSIALSLSSTPFKQPLFAPSMTPSSYVSAPFTPSKSAAEAKTSFVTPRGAHIDLSMGDDSRPEEQSEQENPFSKDKV